LNQITPVTGLTQRLATSIAGLCYENIPEAALTTARRGLADCIGVMIAGSAEPVVALARQTLGGTGTESRLIPGGERTSARDAALINGIAGHVLDYDDVALDGHPSAIMVPALLAESESLGATGEKFLAAYVAGYETWATLWAACAVPLHSLGRHPSSHFGPLAAAAACAHLRGLSASQTTHALGLAAAQSGGLIANFGSMAKSFQVGRAAEAGLLAARLAQAGMTASPHVIEDSAGFLSVFGGGTRASATLNGFGLPGWWILDEGLDIKLYPVCYGTNRVVDCALQLVRDENPDPEKIARIILCIGALQSKMLHSTRPQTPLEAKFSPEFAAAAVFLSGALGFAQLTPSFVLSPQVQSLISKAERRLDHTIGAAPFSPFDQIILHMQDGTTLTSAPVQNAAGSRFAPPDAATAAQKFLDCAAGNLAPQAAEALFAALWSLAPAQKITEVLDLLHD
jgi:2-methylcitrate dehydratase PrpD